jgi:hypothetical protein
MQRHIVLCPHKKKNRNGRHQRMNSSYIFSNRLFLVHFVCFFVFFVSADNIFTSKHWIFESLLTITSICLWSAQTYFLFLCSFHRCSIHTLRAIWSNEWFCRLSSIVHNVFRSRHDNYMGTVRCSMCHNQRRQSVDCNSKTWNTEETSGSDLSFIIDTCVKQTGVSKTYSKTYRSNIRIEIMNHHLDKDNIHLNNDFC